MTRAPVEEEVSPDTPLDRAQSVVDLEKQLAATPRATYPYQHAGIAYRLGLAYAESAGASTTESMRKALACYDLAASIFDPRFDPVPHARVLNAAGAAHRALGDRERAAALFEKADFLLTSRDRDDERAAALNNLGLVRTELGRFDRAVEACDAALELFDTASPEGRRGRAATLHTRGMAQAGNGTEAGLDAALIDYADALEMVSPASAPFHWALSQQAAGVACIALATWRVANADRLLDDAVYAISEALTIFTRSDFPYQYALAKHNLGLALFRQATLPERGDDLAGVRWALACFEEMLAILDPRLYAAAWQQGYANLERAQGELTRRGAEGTRAEHFAALLAGSGEGVRLQLLRERLTRLLLNPEPQRRNSLVELDLATGRLGYDAARAIITAELGVLMELPRPDLHSGLNARFEAHQLIPEAKREEADRALDQAIGDALGGPQRMYVRDFLYDLGWERP